jgi:Tfp pilus assembly protein PilN
MKQHINLLTADLFYEPGVIPAKVQIQYLSIPLLVLVFVGLYGWKVTQASALNNEIATLLANKAQLSQEMDAISAQITAAMEQERRALEAQLAKSKRMQELEAKRVLWSQVFREISLLVPEGVTLAAVSNEPGEAAPQPANPPAAAPQAAPESSTVHRTLHIKGVAVSHEAVTLFLSALERSALFIHPHLSHAQRSGSAEKPSVAFEIIGTLRGPA